MISFSFICWFNNLSVKNRNKQENIVKLSSKIINSQQRSLGQFCSNQVNKKALEIINDKNHILNNGFELMQSGRRYRLPSYLSVRLADIVFHSYHMQLK